MSSQSRGLLILNSSCSDPWNAYCRFFKLFPPLALQEEGMQGLCGYLRQQVGGVLSSSRPMESSRALGWPAGLGVLS